MPRPGRSSRWALVALSGAVLGTAGGCLSSEDCGTVLCAPLPPAITATVRAGPDGGFLSTAVVNGFPFTCAAPACPVQLPDGGIPMQAGSYSLAVSAPGYAPVTRTVTVPTRMDDSCCPLPFQPQQVDVFLSPL